MTNAIAAGDILVEGCSRVASSLVQQNESSPSGWTTVKSDRPTFENDIKEAGWTLFFMAGEIKATVFGFNRQKSLRTALKRLIAMVKSQDCNSLEITQVTGKSFLKVPYVSVIAHVRHLQEGMTFRGLR